MRVLKFGGSSLATPDAIRRVVEIVGRARASGPVAVVVSALGGATDALLEASRRAAAADQAWREIHGQLVERHLTAASAVCGRREAPRLKERFASILADLENLLRGVALVRECSPRSRDRIASTGELLSSELVAAAMRRRGIDAEACDARSLVLTDDSFGAARVEPEATRARLAEHFAGQRPLQVVTGFLGATSDGATTTLGRGGSDLTAALLGAALTAEAIELWTDVDGVLSADPRVVRDASPIAEMSYDELMELSHFGAKVVYPPTVHPARKAGVPLEIRNTFNPGATGTRITAGSAPGNGPVRGISSISRVALARLEGDGMVGVPGIASRLFGALAAAGVNVILISQASSEHSICFAVLPADAGPARRAVDREFDLERRAGLVEPLVVEDDLSVVAVVGQGMCRSVGIAGRLFGELGSEGVNVRAIAQGSSELNVSLVVAKGDEARAVNAIHGRFFGPGRGRVELVVIGAGTVGREVLAQLATGAGSRPDLELRLVGVVTSRRMALASGGIDPGRWREALDAGEPAELAAASELVSRPSGAARVVLDCTASDDVPKHFERWLADGVSVVSANKRPFAGTLEQWNALRTAAASSGAALLHEATVGAGLPVLSTLNDMVRTGDRIRRIEGVLSGTLSFVLARVMAGARLSEAVAEAERRGLTEPRPAEDLVGLDVARKALILARTAGFALEPEAVEAGAVLPREGWLELSADELRERLPELDEPFAARAAEARAVGRSLVSIVTVTPEGARVALEALPPDHPCAGVAVSDNVVAFTSDRYRMTPLVVRGPGAGPEVTAAGLIADVLRASETSRRR